MSSADFVNGLVSGETAHLEVMNAAEAFRQAHGLYRAYGAARMVSITGKNLSHVERLLADRAPKGLPKMSWESEGVEQETANTADEPPPERA